MSYSRLNVVFHGTFCFWFRKTGVTAMAPEMYGESYGIGLFKKEKMLDVGDYRLVLPSRQNEPLPSIGPVKSEYVVLQEKLVGRPTNSRYCAIDLPLPDSFDGLRFAKGDFFLPGTTAYKNDVHPAKLPTIHVFSYYCAPDKAIFDPDIGLRLDPDKDVNVHVFAEHAFSPDPNHVVEALASLVGLFPQAMDLALTPDADTNACVDGDLGGSVPTDQQCNLYERASGQKPCEGSPVVSVRNCIAMAVVSP